MKQKYFLSIFLSVLLIAVAFTAATVSAETDLTLTDTVVADPGGTAIDPDDNDSVDGGILDDFNRANGPIGGNWTNRAGTFQVVSGTARGGYLALATYGGATSTVLEADVACNGTALQYTGLVLAYADINNNLFMKVQQQSPYAGQFTSAAFYYGNNGTGFGPGFFALDYPFTTAHMKVELVGTTVTMTFSEIDGGSGVQTYTATGAPSTGGNGIGICGYDTIASLDNFATPGMDCDYCFNDDAGYDWCLNIITTDSRAYYLEGTCDTGTTPLKDAHATYLYSTKGLTATAYGGASGMIFTSNNTFISSTLSRGVRVSSNGWTGWRDMWLVDCGAATDGENIDTAEDE